MTSPQPMAPHQDPSPQTDPSRVTMLEYVTTLIHTLDRRFDSLHQDLKDALAQRFMDNDLRYQQRFDAQTKALDAALAAQKEAVATANVANEKRFDSVNEFRGQLADIVATFIPRAEAEARFQALSEKIDDLKASVADLKTTVAAAQGQDAGQNVVARLDAMSKLVSESTDKLSAGAGRSAGLHAGWGYLVGAVGLIGGVIAIVVRARGG